MLMMKMAPLAVALCVAVALQPMLAASVQKEERVTKTPVGERSRVARRRLDDFGRFLLILSRALKRWANKRQREREGFLVAPRKGRDFVTGEEESEQGGDALDPITRLVNADRLCADALRNGPLHEGLPFSLIQRQFQTADENGNGALEKTEVKKFLDKLLVLKFCMDRPV